MLAIFRGRKQWRIRTVLHSLEMANSANQNYNKTTTKEQQKQDTEPILRLGYHLQLGRMMMATELQ